MRSLGAFVNAHYRSERMADPRRRHPANAAGPWFVDTTCIDCDASRQCAPEIFAIHDGQSIVQKQPETPAELRRARRALLACPTGSIGVLSAEKQDLEALFPEPLADGLFYVGFNSEDSFGANAYLSTSRAGNLLFDAPRFVNRLVRRLEDMGGVQHVLLTHRDDVADAERFALHFDARVWIHHADRSAAPFATDIIESTAPETLFDEVRVSPLPGHTRGSVAYLVEQRFLFTGDSLYHSRTHGRLSAFRDACWYSWKEQTKSLELLRHERFEWILPGHGQRRTDPPEVLQAELEALVVRMQRDEEDGAW
jgi:glyoxylase-like metal-dependent hydrolase (beta-lactamase superfamily II)/ferredoxin